MRYVLALFFTLISIQANAAILVFSPNGTYTTKTTLSAAATGADVAGKMVVVTSALSAVQSNISSATVHAWPSDRVLKVEKGGSIANTTKFTVNGTFIAPITQVFIGTGTVTFGSGTVKEAYPEWFGTGYTSMRAALTSGAPIVKLTGTYTMTNQITVPTGVTVSAYGAILNWTDFGNTLASTAAEMAATGNAIRMSSNSAWYGGNIKMTSVVTPSNRSIPSGSVSGAFWNMFAIGNFNTNTTASMATATENVTIKDVNSEVVSGHRNQFAMIAGYTRNVVISNITDTMTSTDVSTSFAGTTAKGFIEATWGSDSNYTYHPYNIKLSDLTIFGNNPGANTGVGTGIWISGCYDVTVDRVYARSYKLPMTFYVGDPGDGTHAKTIGTQTIFSSQGGLVNTGLLAKNITAHLFNIGYQVIGDAVGSSIAEPGTHSVKAIASNLMLYGYGSTAATGGWTSNLGVYFQDASDSILQDSTIMNVTQGISVKAPAAGATYTAPTNLKVINNFISDAYNQAFASGTIVNSVISKNRIKTIGLSNSGTNAAAIVYAGSNIQVLNNTFGLAGDVKMNYAIVDAAADAAKATNTNCIWDGNHTLSAVIQAYNNNYATLGINNSVASGVTSGASVQKFPSIFSGVSIYIGNNTPESAITAEKGSLYMRINGGAGTSLYIKESGSGNTGWVGK